MMKSLLLPAFAAGFALLALPIQGQALSRWQDRPMVFARRSKRRRVSAEHDGRQGGQRNARSFTFRPGPFDAVRTQAPRAARPPTAASRACRRRSLNESSDFNARTLPAAAGRMIRRAIR